MSNEETSTSIISVSLKFSTNPKATVFRSYSFGRVAGLGGLMTGRRMGGPEAGLVNLMYLQRLVMKTSQFYGPKSLVE